MARKLDALPSGALTTVEAANLAASFQRAVADVLADRARHAADMMPDATCAVVAGGVAANRTIRAALTEALAPLPLIAPPVALCTDNAVMVAWCGIERLRVGLADGARNPAPATLAARRDARGLNYRHAFHAGNFADCMKHAILVWCFRTMQKKPAGVFVLDTHAGVGRYDLTASEAARTGEWRDGIGRLLDDTPTALADYVGLVRDDLYPGSPALVRALLRPEDRLACCELHPADAGVLKVLFRLDDQVAVHLRDGFGAVGALLPPAGLRRALVLIDPPYEVADDAARVAEALRVARAKMPGATVLAWYPIKHRAPVRALHAAVTVPDVVAAELWLREPLDPARLNGCGLLIANPPFGFEDGLRPILAALLERLGSRDAGEGFGLVRVTGE